MDAYIRGLIDPIDPPDDMWFVAKVAACALLIELSAADGDESPVEVERILDAMRGSFGLDETAVKHVEQLARSARAHGDTAEGYARLLREQWAPDDRKLVLAAVREVIWADGRLDEGEELMVWRLAAMLGLPFDEVRGVLASEA
ncbi:MAG: TerB family tellurite resistance protein [Alphaproteobacteria bacterium]|nr:TerB family tellurite resistance protein [Alphaproteobacteria bacterium]